MNLDKELRARLLDAARKAALTAYCPYSGSPSVRNELRSFVLLRLRAAAFKH